MRYPQFAMVSALVLAAATVAAGCGSSSAQDQPHSATHSTGNEAFPINFTECDKRHTLAHPPKVLVDSPQAAALVAAAGGNRTGRIVAYTEGGDEALGPSSDTLANVPQTAKNTPPSKDVILGAGPDLVIAHHLAPQLSDQLSALGIQTITVNNGCETYPKSHGGRTGYDAIYDDITLIGKLLGTSDYAARSIATMKKTVAHVSDQARSLTRHSVAMIAPYAGDLYAFGSTSIEDTQLRSLHLTNAFADLDGSFVPVSGEKLLAQNPWAIVVAYTPGLGSVETQSLKVLMALPGASQLDAVRNKRVFAVDDVYLTARPADSVALLYTKLRGLS